MANDETSVKQTAIEWLKFNLPSLFEHDNNGFYEKLFEQAKKMEKEQIMKAYEIGFEIGYCDGGFNGESYYDEPEDYYNEIYGKE